MEDQIGTSTDKISIIRSLLVFIFIGPLVPGVLFGLIVASENIGLSFIVVFFAYVIGIVPALISGFIFYLLINCFSHRLITKNRYSTLLFSTVAGTISGSALYILNQGDSALILLFISILSSIICGLIVQRSN